MILSPVAERKFPGVRIDGSQMTQEKNAPDKNIKRRDFVAGLAAISTDPCRRLGRPTRTKRFGLPVAE